MITTIKWNEQHESDSFTIVYVHGQTTEFVEVHKTDMDGWLLYECIILPSYNIHYFSWDEGAETSRMDQYGKRRT